MLPCGPRRGRHDGRTRTRSRSPGRANSPPSTAAAPTGALPSSTPAAAQLGEAHCLNHAKTEGETCERSVHTMPGSPLAPQGH